MFYSSTIYFYIFVINLCKYTFLMLKLRLISEKRLILFFLILTCNIIFSTDVMAQNGKKITSVVIDAGHGGKDPGAVGKKSKEKDITLKVAKMTGDYIKQNCPDVKVIYTRSSDVFVSLLRRAQIANENKADLFISIHCNANSSPQPYGVETFVMGEHRNAANLEVAKKENASILYEENAQSDYGGFDPNSPEAYIMLNFFQSEYKSASLDLAERIQNQMVKRVGRKDRGVQQAGFLVLYKTAMPSVLVEIGFISNPNEENFISSSEGQTYLASAIYRAFRDYKNAYDKENMAEGPAYENISAPQSVVADKAVDADKIVYKIQIESRSKKVDNASQHYKGLNDIDYYEHNGQYKYTTGSFYTKAEADEYCKSVRTKGYATAFVISFKNGTRIN